MRTQLIVLKCDLCGHAMKPQPHESAGWVKITVESEYTDRQWSEFDVCPNCVAKVIAAEKKRTGG